MRSVSGNSLGKSKTTDVTIPKSGRAVFCDLEVAGRLSSQVLSLAMVADDGDELYVERSANSLGGVHLDDFARDHVVSQFGRVANAGVTDLGELGNRVSRFLARQPGALTIIHEHGGLWPCLEAIVRATADGQALLGRLRGMDVSAEVRGSLFEMAAQRSYSKDPLQRLKIHHALADAHALRDKWKARAGSGAGPAERSDGAVAQAFLAGRASDKEGRTLAEVLAWSDARLELTDDFIQWIFPLPEPSPMNPFAPAPSVDEFSKLALDGEVREGFARAAQRIFAFLGLSYDGVKLTRGDNWAERCGTWVVRETHKDRYISRMLGCGALLNFREDVRRVLLGLEQIVPEYRGARAESALRHWRSAANR